MLVESFYVLSDFCDCCFTLELRCLCSRAQQRVSSGSETDPPVSSRLHPLTDHDCLALLMHEQWAQHSHHCRHLHKNTFSFLFLTPSLSLTNMQKHTTTGRTQTQTLIYAGKLASWKKLEKVSKLHENTRNSYIMKC